MNSINKEMILSKISTLAFNNESKLIDNISEIIIKDKDVGFSIYATQENYHQAVDLKKQAETVLQNYFKDLKINITITNQGNKKIVIKTKHYIADKAKVILIAAGKGGVGKSTVATLIAEKLNKQGYKVGLVDADIYGPSIPLIFGLNNAPQIVDKKMIPQVARGIKVISIGLLTNDSTAIAWRGPMATKAIYQLLSATNWGELDYLIIDMPPGTGDIHLSILENYFIDGVVIVTTPQNLSKIDVSKAINLYQKFNLRILGIIENMSYYLDEVSGNKLDLFPGRNASLLANEQNIPFICHLPFKPKIAENTDKGQEINSLADLDISFITRYSKT